MLQARRAAKFELNPGLADARTRQDAGAGWAGNDVRTRDQQIGELLVLEGRLRALGDAVIAAAGQADAEVAPVGR